MKAVEVSIVSLRPPLFIIDFAYVSDGYYLFKIATMVYHSINVDCAVASLTEEGM